MLRYSIGVREGIRSTIAQTLTKDKLCTPVECQDFRPPDTYAILGVIFIMDYIQIILLLWLIERVSVERSRYKIAIDTNGGYPVGYWSIWIYHKGINETRWTRSGGKRLIHFNKYVIPKLG